MKIFRLLFFVAALLTPLGVNASEWHTLTAAEYREMVRADFLRQRELRFSGSETPQDIPPAADAAGAVDGVKDGKWGFHTALEKDPWWQVDLGEVCPLEKIVLWNRCDGDFGGRNSRIRVAVRNAPQETWREVYQHDGTAFGGVPDEKPLTVPLSDTAARFVRLSLDGEVYFHLDEVEIFSDGKNVALGKPASQSSVSQWSVATTAVAAKDKAAVTLEELSTQLECAWQLVEELEKQGVNVSAEKRMILAALSNDKNGVAEIPDEMLEEALEHILEGIMDHALDAAMNSVLDVMENAVMETVDTMFDSVEKGIAEGDAEDSLENVLEKSLENAVGEAEENLQKSLSEEKMKTAVADAMEKYINATPEGVTVETLLAIHRAVRSMTFKNPLLDGVEEILFVKRQTTMFPHVSDQHLGWWSRPGGGIFVLRDFRTDTPKIRCLTAGFPVGNFDTPELSYDGKRVLFAFCKYYPEVAGTPNKTDRRSMPEDSFYHIFEMNVDGSGVRQLTRGYYNDFSPRYLPGGEIIFLSTRKGTSIQAGGASARATEEDACVAESFVRCGGDNYRPVSVFTLHRINADGENLRAISAFENFEWTPTIARDGRILYTRWDYIDRFNGHFMSLWATNPDGTFPNLVYGNYTVRPQVVFEAVQIPGSRKLVFTATAHHSITGGSLVLLDRTRGTEGDEPIKRLTPEVPFPETERNAGHYYANPWPLSEEFFLCSWNDRQLPPHSCMTGLDDPRNPGNAGGIYVRDVFGNLVLLYRDAEITSAYPIPVRPREMPAALPDLVEDEDQADGTFFVHDVHAGLPAEMRGAVKRLRLVAVLPKVQPHMNSPVLGVSAEDTGKAVLGTVPVEADGSAFFRAPAGVSLFFQALDADGYAVQTMRSLTYVRPGQNISCVGCHESRESTPPEGAKLARAFLREPSRITPDPEGSWPLRYDRLVQPILDTHCAGCHSPFAQDFPTDVTAGLTAGLTAAQKKKAREFSLLPEDSYANLLNWNGRELFHLVYEKDRSVAGDVPARKSGLMKIFAGETPHYGVNLAPAERYAVAVWMDTYAHRIGAFSAQQEEELEIFRQRIKMLLEE